MRGAKEIYSVFVSIDDSAAPNLRLVAVALSLPPYSVLLLVPPISQKQAESTEYLLTHLEKSSRPVPMCGFF